MTKNVALQLIGWGLFVISALFFIADSIRHGNMIGLLASLAFLFGCFAFIWALFEPDV